MNKLIYLFLIITLFNSCSFNKNSKFWTSSKILEEEKLDIKKVLRDDAILSQEFNKNLKINIKSKIKKISFENSLLNNTGRLNYSGNFEKSSRYKFSKIKNFHQYEPDIIFFKDNIIFFDNNGSIIQFSEKSKLIWKKNYYSKNERKLNPILQFASNNKYLVIADNIAKYYMVDLLSGDLVWSKNNLAPFNSQIKIYNDKFFIIDFSNTLRCFSLKNGDELWNIKTENSLIRSKKKLSMVIVDDEIYFNNSIGDISAIDINKGELLWQLPTQSSLIYESAFSLETSDMISDKNNLFFSNNKNEFFSIDIKTGSFNWKNKVNSNLRASLVDDYLFTFSLEGFFIIIDKNTGNIIRITDIFNIFKSDKRKAIKPVGFIVGLNNIFLTTSNGRLLIIDIITGTTLKNLKIDNEKISRPFFSDNNLFLIKDNAIIKLQ